MYPVRICLSYWPDVVSMADQRIVFIVVPAYKQHWENVFLRISPIIHVCLRLWRRWYPSKTKLCSNVVLMLAHRLRRRVSMKTTLGQRLIFASICLFYRSATGPDRLAQQTSKVVLMLCQRRRCWANIGSTLGEYPVNMPCLPAEAHPENRISLPVW